MSRSKEKTGGLALGKSGAAKPPRESASALRAGRTPRGIARDLFLALCVLLAVFGLFARRDAFRGRHLENDEQVYRALVGQLEQGRGYNLVGTGFPPEILPPEMYGRPLFYHHPPGGVALFWICWKLAGTQGFAIAQALAFLAFLWGALRLHRVAIPSATLRERAIVATLAAFTPIAAHVSTNHWLDGPLLATATIAASFMLEALRERDVRRAALAGLLLGLASWIKVPALLVLPGALLLDRALDPSPKPDGRWWKTAATLTGVALLVQLPWELWQWAALGTPFPPTAGKPTAELIASNTYERLVTLDRPAWIYAQLLPVVLWSLVPSLLVLFLAAPRADSRRRALALFGWIAGVVLPHAVLGAMGWPKLLRLVVLVTPAALLLAAFAMRHLAEVSGAKVKLNVPVVIASVVLGLGIAAEIAQGLMTTLVHRHDIIVSMWRAAAAVGPRP